MYKFLLAIIFCWTMFCVGVIYAAPTPEQIALWQQKFPPKPSPKPVPTIPPPPPIVEPVVIPETELPSPSPGGE